MLLHGFDSSSLEFRRLWPVLEEKLDTWAVDLVGWGFSNSGAAEHRGQIQLGPKQKRDHLYAFWQEKVCYMPPVPCSCSASALLLPCPCPAPALPMPCPYPVLALPLPCTSSALALP